MKCSINTRLMFGSQTFLKDACNQTCGIDFGEPLSIQEGLRIVDQNHEQLYGVASNKSEIDLFRRNLAKNEELPKVTKLLTSASSSVVFETQDGDVLKLTNGNHFPLNRPVESFDVPIKKHGRSGKTHFYIEEKLYQEGLNTGFVQIIKDKICKSGYKPSDLGSNDFHQIGISEKGKLYLLDPECAKYKTIFHAIWAKIKRH